MKTIILAAVLSLTSLGASAAIEAPKLSFSANFYDCHVPVCLSNYTNLQSDPERFAEITAHDGPTASFLNLMNDQAAAQKIADYSAELNAQTGWHIDSIANVYKGGYMIDAGWYSVTPSLNVKIHLSDASGAGANLYLDIQDPAVLLPGANAELTMTGWHKNIEFRSQNSNYYFSSGTYAELIKKQVDVFLRAKAAAEAK